MKTPPTLTELVSARRRGELDRDTYWAAMQEVHRGRPSLFLRELSLEGAEPKPAR